MSAQTEFDLWNIPADPDGDALAALDITVEPADAESLKKAEAIAREIAERQAPYQTRITAQTLSKIVK